MLLKSQADRILANDTEAVPRPEDVYGLFFSIRARTLPKCLLHLEIILAPAHGFVLAHRVTRPGAPGRKAGTGGRIRRRLAIHSVLPRRALITTYPRMTVPRVLLRGIGASFHTAKRKKPQVVSQFGF